jgi:hypothetical protein
VAHLTCMYFRAHERGAEHDDRVGRGESETGGHSGESDGSKGVQDLQGLKY